MKTAIIVFPGTNRERDMIMALRRVTQKQPRVIWHHETELGKVDLVVLPGGFSYGDYLRCGAMAAHSPIMGAVRDFAAQGGHILGICNGFQILTETRLLPGALLQNAHLRFLSQDCHLRVETQDSPFTCRWKKGDVFRAPLAHGDGHFTADVQTLERLEAEGRVAFRYVDATGRAFDSDPQCNPNGSLNSIAGVLSDNRRICGMMPHPENLVDPLMGGVDGLPLFEGVVEAIVR
ncbi:MAG: phosphoribosylformylglycinamidine synthase subunit PurQ [Acetobacter sp.]|nr:phosphoribosylformylglycinamidine synthase subunit PurQ [Acetobacter sp.]